MGCNFQVFQCAPLLFSCGWPSGKSVQNFSVCFNDYILPYLECPLGSSSNLPIFKTTLVYLMVSIAAFLPWNASSTLLLVSFRSWWSSGGVARTALLPDGWVARGSHSRHLEGRRGEASPTSVPNYQPRSNVFAWEKQSVKGLLRCQPQ